jgi:hypothetical protein
LGFFSWPQSKALAFALQPTKKPKSRGRRDFGVFIAGSPLGIME